MFSLLLLAVVQIIGEVLPISSSAHMRLAALLADHAGVVLPPAPQYFDEFLHAFTLVAVLVFFRRDWLPLLQRLWQLLTQGQPLRPTQRRFLRHMVRMVLSVGEGVLLTVVVYFAAKHPVLAQPLSRLELLPVGLVCTGLLLALTGRVRLTGVPASAGVSLMLAAQLVACLVPGLSRFASTVFAGVACGLAPRRAVRWSWLLFVPLMAAAGFVHGVGGFVLKAHNYFVFEPLFFAVCVLAAAVSYAIFAGVEALYSSGRSWLLGLYMLLPALLAVFLCQ